MFYLLPPSAFNFAQGYTYVEILNENEATPIASGFYEGRDMNPVVLEVSHTGTPVQEEEALDGIGTYLGAMVVTSDESQSRTDPTWIYATVIAYNFNRNNCLVLYTLHFYGPLFGINRIVLCMCFFVWIIYQLSPGSTAVIPRTSAVKTSSGY